MPNEILIILSFIIIYGGVVAFYRFFGKGGLLAFNVLALHQKGNRLVARIQRPMDHLGTFGNKHSLSRLTAI